VAEGRTRESIAATERERGRWARELHDESLQSLAGLRVLLSAARRSEPGELDGLLSQGIEQIDAAIAEMRRLIADLRPSTLDQLGLGAALETLGERTGSAGAIEVRIDLDLDFESGRSETRLRGDVEDTAYRLVQEALNNAIHHGEAQHVAVEVREEGGSLRVRVADDGKGFDPNAQTSGFGLIGMRERAELAGGSLELRSAPGEGTTIDAIVPVIYRTEKAA
jgi:signal transduction histidine kinase